MDFSSDIGSTTVSSSRLSVASLKHPKISDLKLQVSELLTALYNKGVDCLFIKGMGNYYFLNNLKITGQIIDIEDGVWSAEQEPIDKLSVVTIKNDQAVQKVQMLGDLELQLEQTVTVEAITGLHIEDISKLTSDITTFQEFNSLLKNHLMATAIMMQRDHIRIYFDHQLDREVRELRSQEKGAIDNWTAVLQEFKA